MERDLFDDQDADEPICVVDERGHSRGHSFTWFDNAVMDYLPLIGPNAFAVYGVVVCHAQGGEVPDLTTIARQTGTSERVAQDALDTLLAVGLLAQEGGTYAVTDVTGPSAV
jgi:hypothetical protein